MTIITAKPGDIITVNPFAETPTMTVTEAMHSVASLAEPPSPYIISAPAPEQNNAPRNRKERRAEWSRRRRHKS